MATTKVHDWAAYYARLHAAGRTDSEIAALAGVTRHVINRVRLGKYPHPHTLEYHSALRVLAALQELEQDHDHDVGAHRAD